MAGISETVGNVANEGERRRGMGVDLLERLANRIATGPLAGLMQEAEAAGHLVGTGTQKPGIVPDQVAMGAGARTTLTSSRRGPGMQLVT